MSANDAECLKLLKKLASPEVLERVKKDRKMATSRRRGTLHLYLTEGGLNERGSYPDSYYDINLGDIGRYVPCTSEVNRIVSPSIDLIHRYNLSKNELECWLSMLGFK